MKKKTQQEFENDIFKLVNNEYTVLSEYINNKTKIKMLHKRCKKEYEIAPNRFLSGDRCPFCSTKKKKTTESFKKEVKESVNKEYIVLGEYINKNTKIKIKHTKCNSIFEIRPTNFLRGQRCPECFGNNKKTTESFKKEVKELTSNEYTVLGEYINNRTKIKMKHNICNNVYEVTPSNFLDKENRCPKCSMKKVGENNTKNTEWFKNNINNLVGDEYTVLGEYINNKTKIKMKHNICNNVYEVTPNKFISLNRRCPFCCESKGEKRIKEYLDFHNIKYQTEKRFNGCRNKLPLPFDFYLEDLNICIEYDGKQHFKPYMYNDIKSLELQKYRDSIKTNFCKKEKIKLIRIPYTDFENIENILDIKLNELADSF